MGGNGKLLQVHHGKCMKMFQQERKMEKNGVEMSGKWVKNWTRSGNFCIFPDPILPIFPKGQQFPCRAVNKKFASNNLREKWGIFEVSTGIQKIGYFLGLRSGAPPPPPSAPSTRPLLG